MVVLVVTDLADVLVGHWPLNLVHETLDASGHGLDAVADYDVTLNSSSESPTGAAYVFGGSQASNVALPTMYVTMKELLT